MSARNDITPSSWLRGHDPNTLREQIDPRLASARLHTLDGSDTLAADAERVTLLRVLGHLDDALTQAGQTVQRALAEGTPVQAVAARIRLGQVHQYRSETEPALLWLRAAHSAAAQLGDTGLQSLAKVHEGKTLLEASRPEEASGCFATALDLRSAAGASPSQLEPIRAAIMIAEQRAEELAEKLAEDEAGQQDVDPLPAPGEST